MAENKKQHYVPKFYMNNFATNGKYYLLNIANSKLMERIPIDDQCKKDYFYGSDLQIEKMLSKKELEWSNTIKFVLDNKRIGSDNKYYLKEFVICQLQRTLYKNKQFKDIIINGFYEVTKFDYNNKMIGLPENAKEEVESFVDKKIYNKSDDKYNEKMLIDLIPDLINEVDDLDLLLIDYGEQGRLVSSDNPVVTINMFEPHSIGLNNIGVILLCPLSSRFLLVLYDPGVYTKYKGIDSIKVDDIEEMKELNRMQYMQADSIIYSKYYIDINIFDRYEEQRKEYINQQNVTMLSGLMGIHDKRLITNFPLSFANITHIFKRIPFLCKDSSIPRKCDKGWLDRIINRQEIMTVIPETKKLILENMTIKEFNRGCKRYVNAVENYWRRNKTFVL